MSYHTMEGHRGPLCAYYFMNLKSLATRYMTFCKRQTTEVIKGHCWGLGGGRSEEGEDETFCVNREWWTHVIHIRYNPQNLQHQE